MYLQILISLITLLAVVSGNTSSSSTSSSITPPVAQSTTSTQTPAQIASTEAQHDAAYYTKMSQMSDADWQKILTPDQFQILRKAGTETPFTSPLAEETRAGTYYSVGCDEPLFRSEQKFDSGTGWPSFWAPIQPDAVSEKTDNSIPFESRTEILDRCGNHLGHVFNDGPQPTGLRYCMNGLALKFVPDDANAGDLDAQIK